MSPERFPLDYSGPLAPLMRAFGLLSRWSGLEVASDLVRVQMGWAFRSVFPRSDVRTVRRDPGTVTGWGVHGWRGRWLVNVTSEGVVRLEIEPTARAYVLGVPVRLRTLRVSVADPDAVLRALGSA